MIHNEERFQTGKRRILWSAAALLALIFVLFLIFGLQSEAGPLQGETPPADGEAVRTFTVEETSFQRDGKHIYAKLLLPRGEGPFPLVILAHGFNGNSDKVEPYAMAYAENGIASCVFDFIGGGEGSRSDGSIRDMSVLTEAADLNAVIDSLKQRKEFDPTRIFLFGRSQGGFVAAYVAEERPQDIRAVQLAKAAIAAGILLLARKLGVSVGDIEEVDIAGAFGNYIDPDSACAIGLIPAELRRKIRPVGNAAGAGAKLALTDANAWAEAETLARTTEFLELATLPEFQDEFVEQLNFYEEEE